MYVTVCHMKAVTNSNLGNALKYSEILLKLCNFPLKSVVFY